MGESIHRSVWDRVRGFLVSPKGRRDFLSLGRALIPAFWLAPIVFLCIHAAWPTPIISYFLLALILRPFLILVWMFSWALAPRWRKIRPGNLLLIWLIWVFELSYHLPAWFNELRRVDGFRFMPAFLIHVPLGLILIVIRKYLVWKWKAEIPTDQGHNGPGRI